MGVVEPPTFVRGERPRPEWLRRNRRAWIAAVGTVCFGAFMGQLDASIVALTYTAIGRTFATGLSSVQWITLAYLITLGALLMPLGRLSDRIGRKRVYLWGFGLFTASSAGCALAPSLATLAATRAVQGVGAAMLQANSVAIVATSAPRGRLRTALGIQASAQAVGLALGPTVGGILVQTIGWRWVFAVNVPVGVLAMMAGRYLIPRTRLESTSRGHLRDVFGAHGVPRGLLGALLAYLLLFGPIVLVPNVLQPRGVTPLAAGLIVAALPVGFAVGALAGERLPASWPAPRRGLLGIALATAGIAGLLPVAEAGAVSAISLLAAGLGLGVFTPTNNAMIMGAIPSRASALGGGLVSTARAAGTAAGTALVATTLAVSGAGILATVVLLVLAGLCAATVPRQPAAA